MNSHTRLCLSVLIVSATFCLYAASAGSQSGAPRRITTTAEHSLNLNPTLSGDGRVVAFESTADLSDTAGPAGFRFLRANLAGGDALRFTQLASSRAPAPAMSQDGARLAFASRADLSGANRDGNFEIFFHDGARLRQVTDTTPETPAQAAVEGNFQPSISDDGGLLAFASNRDLTGANRDGNSEIFLYDTRLGSFRQLTDSVGVFGASGAKLSGDGTHVAFVQDNGTQAGGPSETRDLVLLEIASGIVRVLAVNVNQLGLTHGRAISDDGARVVYSTISDAGERQILFSDGRNGVVRQITSLADAARDVPPHPTISGDGARIAFATKRNVNGMNPDRSVELYLYDIPTNQLSLITNAPREADAEIVSSLSDDGSIIAFNFPRVLSGSVTSLEFNDNSEIYALDLPARVPFSTALHATHAATFGGEPAAIKTLAPGQIAVATGTNLALVTAQTVRGVGGAFPRSQANVQLFVNNRPAQLFFVSPTQFNFQVPPETEIGVAEFAVRNHDGYVSRTPVNVSASAPGVFTETGDGAGAAVALESQTFLRLPFDPVGPNGELRRLTIFGTGLRGAARVEVEVGGRPLAVERIVASPDLPGLDEIHVRLRHELAGAGVVPLVVRADGRDSNPTTLEFGGTRRPASIILTPLTARIGVGRKARFAATVLDIEGLVIPDAPVAFSSTEAGVAQVNSAGEAVGLRAGNTSIAAASGPTVTRAALEVYPLTLVLNEALADPPDGSAGDANQDGVRSASQDEFVEIVNASEADLDLGGYSILTRNSSGSDTLRHAFAPETILAPGASVVVFGSAQAATFDPSHPAFGGALVLTASTGGLSLLNGGSTITLADPSGQTIEHLTYGGSMGLEGDRDQSLTRAPDIGGEFAPHLNAGGADLRRFSPGAHLDGTPFEITVPLARLEIEPVAASIVTGDRQQFDARAFAADGREIPGVIFRWTTGDASLASVNSQGLVHGLSVGVTTITATARNVRAVAALTVREPPPVLQRIELSPSSAIVLVGNEQQFTARGFDQFNRVMTEVELSFATSDASTASIVGVMAAPSTGVATATLRGLRAGEARITASAPGAGTATVTSNAAVLRVNEPPRVIQRLDIEPVAGFALNRGGTRQLTARAYDQNNQVVLGVVFDWSTNTPHVATIDQAGLCRAVGVGQTTITVSASNGAGGSISAQVTLTAVAPLVINEIHADVAPDDPATAAVEGDANRDG
ncbi:MAG: Ig-like domain-containing protein, partial [Pyrinomonadaceae bacterium]